MWDRRARLAWVKDGDTIEVVLDQGFGDTKQIAVRLLGVWAPELSEVGGDYARNFVVRWFMDLPATSWPFIVTTVRMKTTDKEQMTFDRYVATVTSADGSRSLNADAIAYLAAQNTSGAAA